MWLARDVLSLAGMIPTSDTDASTARTRPASLAWALAIAAGRRDLARRFRVDLVALVAAERWSRG